MVGDVPIFVDDVVIEGKEGKDGIPLSVWWVKIESDDVASKVLQGPGSIDIVQSYISWWNGDELRYKCPCNCPSECIPKSSGINTIKKVSLYKLLLLYTY